MIPNILAIAGSDPSGGAGIQADIKAISAMGGYAMAAVTALTAQNTRRVAAVISVDPPMIAEQIATVREDVRIDAVKIGMLGDAHIVRAVVQALEGIDAPIVLDPVMVAKGGDRLLQEDAVAALRAALSIATAITPNLPEAADLLGEAEATDRDTMERQAAALLAFGPKVVLLKGGHLAGDRSPDLLLWTDGSAWLDAPRVSTRNTHGTGCTLSSAFATTLGAGLGTEIAARAAKAFVGRAIAGADELKVGGGHGPLDHFATLRPHIGKLP